MQPLAPVMKMRIDVAVEASLIILTWKDPGRFRTLGQLMKLE